MNTAYKTYVALFILSAMLFSCKEQPFEVSKVSATQQKIDSVIVEDQAINDIIQPYRDHINKRLDAVLAYAPKDLVKNDGKLESTLGNFMADATMARTKSYFYNVHKKNIDFALFNYGGMRSPILKGNVTTRTAFELMPFENELVVVELSYEKVMEMCDYLVKAKKAHPVSGIELVVDKEAGEMSKILIEGKSLQKDRTYLVLTTDYLQQGGDNMKFFGDPISLTRVKYKLRNALIDYFKEGIDTVQATLDKRMSYAE